jgi:hypothetical protein
MEEKSNSQFSERKAFPPWIKAGLFSWPFLVSRFSGVALGRKIGCLASFKDRLHVF